jgi:DNA-binding beta-propeller fold protein YncE
VVALGTAGALAAATPSTAAPAATGSGIHVVAKGLDVPFGLQKAVKHRGFVVAESASGEVTRVFKSGRTRTIFSGAPGVAGVAASPKRVFAVIGGQNEQGDPSGGSYGPSKVLRMDYHGKHVKVIADLMKYELKHNPDGQVQFVDGHPVDALSNPFAMTWSKKFGLFVADGGANDVLRINPRTGRVHTFFVPKTVKKAGCENSNPGTTGCDPVPTGVQVLGNSLYVSTLGAEVPGAGRIYKLNARTGKVQRVWKHLTAPTGVAARADGTIYFSQVLYPAPAGPPGRITRIRNGHRTHAPVVMPTGVVLQDGVLYSTAFSLMGPGAGQVVRVRDRAFH